MLSEDEHSDQLESSQRKMFITALVLLFLIKLGFPKGTPICNILQKLSKLQLKTNTITLVCLRMTKNNEDKPYNDNA